MEINDKYKTIGEEIIREQFPDLQDVRIAWLSSDEEKKKNRMKLCGECVKVSQRYSWCCPYDFMIIIYEQNICLFTEEQIKILIEHEIRHIGVDDEGVETAYYIVPHDVEEFWGIIEKHGLHWAEKE